MSVYVPIYINGLNPGKTPSFLVSYKYNIKTIIVLGIKDVLVSKDSKQKCKTKGEEKVMRQYRLYYKTAWSQHTRNLITEEMCRHISLNKENLMKENTVVMPRMFKGRSSQRQ